MRPFVRLSCIIVGLSVAATCFADDKPRKTPFRPLSNAQTWKRLPQERLPLPVWARILSRSLPKTTAAMLELDYVHRAENPLDPKLRGKLRFVAALANRCEYSLWYADADLRRAGLKPAAWKGLLGDWKTLPAKERIALEFARKMTIAAYTVTDQEFAALLKAYGPKTVVAMVHTLAHANFQDRIFLALDIAVEEDGPYPPLDIRPDDDRQAKITAPKRRPWKTVQGVKVASPAVKLDWEKHSTRQVRKLLESQKGRKSRIPVPKSNGKRRGDSRIVWSAVSMGYQPELTEAWFTCMGTFQGEASFDRVFANSMFWIITRSNECFY